MTRAFVFLLMMLMVASATVYWEYPEATSRSCFNISPTVALYGSGYSFHSIMNISLPQNTTFWSGDIRAYHPATGRNIDVFNFANSTSDEYFFLPTESNIAGGASDQYCIYANHTAENEPADIAPFGLGFDTSFGNLDNLSTGCTPSYTWNGTYVTINCTNGRTGVYELSASGTNDLVMFGRFRPLTPYNQSGMVTSGYMLTTSTFGSWSAGVGISNNSLMGNWYRNSSYLNPYNTSFNIYSIQVDTAAPYTIISTVYDSNMTKMNSTSSPAVSGVAGNARYSYLAFANNSTVEYDWAIMGYYPNGESLSVSAEKRDMQDPHISFLSPSWNSGLSISDTAPIVMGFSQAYTDCNLSIGTGAVLHNFVPGAGSTESYSLDMSTGVSGDNTLNLTCDLGGTKSHRYWNIVRTGLDVDSLFTRAFGTTPSALGCNATIQTEFSNCFEAYNISERVDFGAVICRNMNHSLNFSSCLPPATYNNITKNNYTIFYSPSGFLYPGSGGAANLSIEHIGANFIYGASLYPRIEIMAENHSSDGYFVYIPAQDKARDCSIYYDSTTLGCSYGYGFILNNQVTIVSDAGNNWYTAGGAGISGFDINISQSTPPTTLYPIVQASSDVFSNGIYKRLNCYQTNNTFKVRLDNSVIQDYLIVIVTNGSGTDVFNSTSYKYSVDIALTNPDPALNVLNVSVYGNNNSAVCGWNTNTNILLPFQMPNLIPQGYDIIISAMMVFMVVLTSIVPFAALLVIIWNDIYHVMTISQISLICMLSILFGFVNASFNMERGLKHMLIILCIATAYLAAIHPYADDNGIDIAGFDGVADSFNSLRSENPIETFVYSIPQFILNIFILILSLPIVFMAFIMSMLKIISLPLWNASQSIAPYLTVGFTLYFYLKAYEVLSNRYRPV